MSNNKAVEILRAHGIHPSVQRIAIMDYLLSYQTHPTAEDVYTALCDRIPTLSRTTIYNTLRLFAETGAARLLTIDEKKICFDGILEPHAHFMCKRCGRMIDVEIPSDLISYLPQQADFKVEESHIYYKGLCKQCAADDGPR